jgi:hypothetical protein
LFSNLENLRSLIIKKEDVGPSVVLSALALNMKREERDYGQKKNGLYER